MAGYDHSNSTCQYVGFVWSCSFESTLAMEWEYRTPCEKDILNRESSCIQTQDRAGERGTEKLGQCIDQKEKSIPVFATSDRQLKG